MGTELLYALNQFSTSSKNHGDMVNIETAEFLAGKRLLKDSIWTGFNRIQESMERMIEQYSRESMKKTMLKQEEIFKEQVRELHRLYRVQKVLMAEVRKKLKLSSVANAVPREIEAGFDNLDADTATSFWSTSTGSATTYSPFSNYFHNPTQMIHYDFNQCLKSRAGTSSQELTSCSRDSLRLHSEFDLEQPAEEDTSTDINVSKDQEYPDSNGFIENKMTINEPCRLPYCDDAESDIELTLNIGYSTNKKKQKHRSSTILDIGHSELNYSKSRQLIPSVMVRSDQEEKCNDTIPSAAFEEERIQCPQWLFQSMSLNRT